MNNLDSLFAIRINEVGQVVTSVSRSDTRVRAVLWENGRVKGLGDAPEGEGWYHAASINTAGQIAGTGRVQGRERPFYWEVGTTGATVLAPLLAAEPTGGVFDVNEVGVVVGFSRSKNGVHAVLWKRVC